jgi:predicted RNA-binding Zn-ribbon protein involved in translation (DUF1610 family)
MDGKRCMTCGEVRWSIRPRRDGRAVACPACGEPMVEERRRPGREARFVREERRDAGVFPSRVKLS